jgi:hypothetical protein
MVVVERWGAHRRALEWRVGLDGRVVGAEAAGAARRARRGRGRGQLTRRGAYCWPLPSVASVVRASAASYVVVWVKCWGAMAGRRSAAAAASRFWLRRESMLLIVGGHAVGGTQSGHRHARMAGQAGDGDEGVRGLQRDGDARRAAAGLGCWA